jgi:hypothetical protein
MNNTKLALIFTALITATAFSSMGQMAAHGQRASPHDTINTRIGGKLVTITYGRPLSKDRKIWGGLVPWDKAWRLGADEATTLLNQAPIVIGGVTLQPGAYTLYMVPSETGTSKLAVSKTTGAWGIPVDEKNDIVRVDLKKTESPTSVDQLTLALGRGTAANSGELKISWEKTQYSVEFTNAP